MSDNLKHDTVAVYAYQKLLVEYLKKTFKLSKMIYFTDGATQHFKNKFNFQNLLHHEKDFGVPAEWHFHATAHGKGPCDGIGGNLKRLARLASLKASSKEQILNCNSFYAWAKENFKETEILFSSKENQNIIASELKIRFESAKTIPRTQKFHCFVPISSKNIEFRRYSFHDIALVFPKIRKASRKKRIYDYFPFYDTFIVNDIHNINTLNHSILFVMILSLQIFY